MAKSSVAATLAFLFVLVFVLLASGCTSPTEQANRYYENGMRLLRGGKPVKASLEFRNALQIIESMHRATYGLALAAEQQADWGRMLMLLDRVIEQDPSHWEAHLKRGQLLLGAGRLDDAMAASATTLALAPERTAALALRAAVLLKAGKSEEARAFADAALARDPGNVEALVILAKDRLDAGKPQEAIGYLDRGLSHSAGNIGLALLKIQVLESLGAAARAHQLYRDLIEANPDVAELRRSLARFHTRHGRPGDAEAELRALVARYPGSLDAKLDVIRHVGSLRGPAEAIAELEAFIRKSPAQTDLQFVLADLHQAQNRPSDAITLLRKVVADQGQTAAGFRAKERLATSLYVSGERNPAARLIDDILLEDPRNPQGLFLRAAMAIEARKLDQAIADLRTVLRDSPDSARALLALAEAYRLSGSPELADSQYRQAFRAGEATPAYGLAYGSFLIASGRYDRAEQVLEHTLRIAPESYEVLLMRAESLRLSGRTEEAIRLYERLLRERPDSDVIANNLASLLSDRRTDQPSLNRAYELAQRFRSSEIAHFTDTLGWASYRMGRYDQAVALLERAVAKKPDIPLFRYHLGMGYMALENIPYARRELEVALELAHRTPFAQSTEAKAALLRLATATGRD